MARELVRVSPQMLGIFPAYAGQLGRGLGPCPYIIKQGVRDAPRNLAVCMADTVVKVVEGGDQSRTAEQ